MNISIKDLQKKTLRIQQVLIQNNASGILLRSIPSHLYLTGTVFQGYTFIPATSIEPLPLFFVERATSAFNGYDMERVFNTHKPELIPPLLKEQGYDINQLTIVELSELTVTEYQRLAKLSDTGTLSETDGTTLMRNIRSIKTEEELSEIRRLATIHMELYRLAPELYKAGMTDLQWQHELEYQMRKRGSIGFFRAFGSRMEIFMGNVSAGNNAGTPAPYDFALGGGGSPALPLGANGTEITPGTTVMLDLAGNFGTYTTDISRTYSLGTLPEVAHTAHQLSLSLHHWFQKEAHAGTPIASIYQHCIEEVAQAGLQEYFMGTQFQAKFVGHGLGIEINEPPVLTQRWHGNFQENMVIALEPKFVIPTVGAVGIENTYIITTDGAENITPLPEDIIPLD